MTRWRLKQKTRTGKCSPSEILAVREARRTSAISAAIRELSRIGGQGGFIHALVAERTGLPLEFIQWKYPAWKAFYTSAIRTQRQHF
jgi:hypothetical protein